MKLCDIERFCSEMENAKVSFFDSPQRRKESQGYAKGITIKKNVANLCAFTVSKKSERSSSPIIPTFAKSKTMKNTKSILSTFPVTSAIIVQWADMDAAQHVNNVIYLRWAEVSRVDYFDALKTDVVPMNGDAGFILSWQDCKYIFPVTYPDTVHIGIRVVEVKEDRFLMESHFFSEKHDRIVAISKQMVVTYDYLNLKKVAVSDLMKERIAKVEGEI